MGKVGSVQPLPLEQQFRTLVSIFERNGLSVRRENLSSGRSFRVKSGNCLFGDRRIIFIDKKLALEQQLSTLTDLLLEFNLKLSWDDLKYFPQHLRTVLERSLRVNADDTTLQM